MGKTQLRSFGQRLRQERTIHQLTREELAEEIGGTVPSLERWEYDQVTPRAKWLKELIRVFGRVPELWGTCRWRSVPYFPNQYFTGREQVLERLHNVLVSDKNGDAYKIIVLSGLGGIGKTQIALEFVDRYDNGYDAMLWVQADTRQTINASFADIAQVLDIPDRKNLNPYEVIEKVKDWLQTHSRWLMIFDNVDDMNMVFKSMPSRYNGAVLITTRFQNADPRVRFLEVEKMSHLEGAQFLRRRASICEDEDKGERLSNSERDALYELWEAMGGLPLALDQAGAYIRVAQCTFQEYMTLYKKRRKEFLIEREASGSEHPEAVATTWNLSFQRIEQKNPLASELLRFYSFLAPDTIPEKLIIWGKAHCTTRLQKLADSDKLLRDAIKILYSYSLIQRNPTTQMLTVHRLVQFVLIDAMPVEVRNEWKVCVARILNAAFSEALFQDWGRCGQLLPHVQVCVTEIEDEPILTQLEAANLFDKVGSYLREQGQYGEAETLLLLALTIHEQHLEADDLAIATSLSNLAGVYFYQDRYQQTTSLIERALIIRKRRLGEEHPEAAASLKHLALLYLRQERYEQAELLLQQSLSITERYTGYESLDTTNRMENLALLYLGREQYDKAELLLKKAFSINKHLVGTEHPITARTMENLAFIYLKQGRYKRATSLFCRALRIHTNSSGLESPDATYPLYGLAELCRIQKKYEWAEQIHQWVLSIRQQHLGKKHLDTAESLEGLADLYREWARYEEAAPFYVQALAIRENILGWESPSILRTRQIYAALLQIMGLAIQVA